MRNVNRTETSRRASARYSTKIIRRRNAGRECVNTPNGLSKKQSQRRALAFASNLTWRSESAHVGQKLAIRLGFGHSFHQQLHRFHGRKRVQDFAQDPDALQVFLGDQQFFFSRSGALNVDRREDALVDQLTVCLLYTSDAADE